MKRYLLHIVLMSWASISFAQNLTPPQVQGLQSASTMKVSFPFGIKGISFSEIPNSVWYPNSKVIAELHMTYYFEGDANKYFNKVVKVAKPAYKTGSWSFSDLTIEATPHHNLNKTIVDAKTSYMLSVFHEYNGVRSAGWYANIHRNDIQIRKIPAQKLGPIKVHPKDKVILNPQPIPPKTDKKLIKIKG